MIEVALYLHEYVYDSLTSFGPLEHIVNKVIQAGTDGLIPLENLPATPPRSCHTCRQVHVCVDNPVYEELIATHGARSPRVSLRRILYDFVDNERWTELGWKGRSQDFAITSAQSRYAHLLRRLVSSLNNVVKQAPSRHSDTLKGVAQTIMGLIHDEQRSDT